MGRDRRDDGPPHQAPREHFTDNRLWIEATYAGHETLDLALHASGALLGGHGSCPEELDPLIDLPHDIESRHPQLQLDELEAVYGAEVMHGLGLHLISFERAEEPWQWRLQEATERRVAEERARQGDVDLDTIIIRQLRLYDAREAQFHWACEALGWPGEWALAYLRHSGSARFDYGPPHRTGEKTPEDPYPAADPELEMALRKRHGPCPDSVEPLRELDARASTKSCEEQLAMLERRFGPWARRRAAIEEFLAGEDTSRADELAEQLRREIKEKDISSAEAMRGILRESVRLEALICWTAQALGLEPSSVVNYLGRRAAAKG